MPIKVKGDGVGIKTKNNADIKERRTKSKNIMQITEFPARLSRHKRVLRETEKVGEVFVSQVFQEHRLLPLKKSSKSSTIPVCF